MKPRNLWLALLLVVAVAALGAAPSLQPSDLVVHEWGTFLAMQGSDGVSLDGMYHEEHALPAFVHSRSRDQLRLPSVILKGETPVIYFYTPRRQKIHVDVRFPRGVWTQWYPQAQVVGPQLAETASPLEPRNGRIVWCGEVVPASRRETPPELPATGPGALWNFAREVDAAYVQTTDNTTTPPTSERERFLFYRGLGQAPLPLSATAANGGTLSWSRIAPGAARHLFILRVEGGKGVYRYLSELAPGCSARDVLPSMEGARPIDAFSKSVGDDLAARLTESGLYPAEARAMVNTWKSSYFRTDGVRVLFVLPQTWTDRFVPMEIRPRPKERLRVMVGRVEMLTPDRERRVAEAVGKLASSIAGERERAFDSLREEGRYVEPILRRLVRTARDANVRALCLQLIGSEFVTELRAAIHSAATGARIHEDLLPVRAQLASLLRQIGRNNEATAEGEAVCKVLERRAPPPMSDPNSRQYLRALARAMEGRGEDRGAAEWYGRFVHFGSQLAGKTRCGGCHNGRALPQGVAWLRDWWAGRKFALYTARSGRLSATIADAEARLRARPGDTAARMMLVYLYDSRHETAKAAKAWEGL